MWNISSSRNLLPKRIKYEDKHFHSIGTSTTHLNRNRKIKGSQFENQDFGQLYINWAIHYHSVWCFFDNVVAHVIFRTSLSPKLNFSIFNLTLFGGSWREVISVISDLWLRDSRCVQPPVLCTVHVYCMQYSTPGTLGPGLPPEHLAQDSYQAEYYALPDITRNLQPRVNHRVGPDANNAISLHWCHILSSPLSLITLACGPLFPAPWCFLLAPDMTYCGPGSL